jgi:CheY-like chemotaxis protein
MYAWAMRAGGWLVEAVVNGEEALWVAPDFEPDVIVMDLRLPVIDGLEATRRLKADTRTMHIPVVVCSGVEGSRAQVSARQAGCDAFIPKPCLPEHLRALLESLVRGRGDSSA